MSNRIHTYHISPHATAQGTADDLRKWGLPVPCVTDGCTGRGAVYLAARSVTGWICRECYAAADLGGEA